MVPSMANRWSPCPWQNQGRSGPFHLAVDSSALRGTTRRGGNSRGQLPNSYAVQTPGEWQMHEGEGFVLLDQIGPRSGARVILQTGLRSTRHRFPLGYAAYTVRFHNHSYLHRS